MNKTLKRLLLILGIVVVVAAGGFFLLTRGLNAAVKSGVEALWAQFIGSYHQCFLTHGRCKVAKLGPVFDGNERCSHRSCQNACMKPLSDHGLGGSQAPVRGLGV